ncbi:MAG: integrase [Bacteriovoracaceae bacterium]
MSKYKKLPNHVGIRKVISSAKYEALKSIKGKVFSKTFNTVKEAVLWRNTFNPFEQASEKSKHSSITFSELWEKYEEIHFATVEKSTQGIKRQKIAIFMTLMGKFKISEITPDYIDYIIRQRKKEAIANPKSKRFNFDKPLDELKAIFSWHRENYDYKFHNPVLKRHYSLGIIKKTIRKEKVLTQEQLVNFIRAIDSPLYQDFAIIQFFCASRFGEIAGIQLKNIDLANNSLLIKEVVVEDQSKKFLELKMYPKNGHTRAVSISSDVFKMAIVRRLNDVRDDCTYLFHDESTPLRYRHVQYRYNKGLKAIGLFPAYSGTHFMRYTMATESRRLMGTLDAAQSVTGHHSIKMAEQYAKIPTNLQAETVKCVGLSLEKCWDKQSLIPVI